MSLSMQDRIDPPERVLLNGSIDPPGQAALIRVVVGVAKLGELEGTGRSDDSAERVAFNRVYLPVCMLPEGLHKHLTTKYTNHASPRQLGGALVLQSPPCHGMLRGLFVAARRERRTVLPSPPVEAMIALVVLVVGPMVSERGMDEDLERLPMSARRGPAFFIAVLLVVVAVMILGVMPLEIYRDYAFICENTGSHKGYRQWRLGGRTQEWYSKSELEEFMLARHPTELKYRWTSYSGTGKNIFGQSIRFGHDFPTVGAVIMDQSWFDSYVVNLDDQAKLDLYRALASGNRSVVEIEEKKIEESVLRNARVK